METTGRSAARIGDRRSHALFPSVFRALLFSTFAFAAFLLIFAFLLYRGSDPGRLLLPVALAAAGVVSLLGGAQAGRLYRQSGPLAGLLHGMMLVFFFLLGAAIVQGGKLTAAALPLYLGMLLCSTVGGLLSTHKKKRRTRRRR